MKIAIGITGASGSIYSKVLLEKLVSISDQWSEIGVVITENAKQNWNIEYPDTNITNFPFKFYGINDFNAPFASGSADYDVLIICPTSMGTIAKIASGLADNLITRAADVILKERKKLIVIPRETPYNLIHLRNMTILTEAGGIVCPASPSFYSKPQTFEALVATVIDRVIALAGLKLDAYQWGS